MLRPLLAITVSSLLFPLVVTIFREIRQQDELLTVIFHSSLLNCVSLWTVLWFCERRGAVSTSILRVHLLRGLLAAVVATTIVYSMKYMQVDLALTVLMSAPIWIVLLARFWILERVSRLTWVAVGLGFLGIIITTNPGMGGLNFWVLVMLVASLGSAVLNTMMTRYKQHGDSPRKWATYTETGVMISSILLWLIFDRQLLTLELLWLYLLIPLTFLPAVYFINYAFLYGRASDVSPLGYLQIPAAVLYGWLVFSGVPEPSTYFGAVLIIFAGLLLFRTSQTVSGSTN